MEKHLSAGPKLIFDRINELSLIIKGDVTYVLHHYKNYGRSDFDTPYEYLSEKDKLFSTKQRYEDYMIALSLYYSMYKKMTKSTETIFVKDQIFREAYYQIQEWLNGGNEFFRKLDKEQKLLLSIAKTGLYIKCFDLTFNDELRIIGEDQLTPLAYYYFVSPGSSPNSYESEAHRYNDEDNLYLTRNRILMGQDYIVDFLKTAVLTS